MSTVQAAILEHTRRTEEGAVLGPKSFLHLGTRAAVDQAFSRLARSGELLRVSRGRYVRPRQTRFGPRAPSPRRLVEQLAEATGEVIVPGGATEAHSLGLTAQVPVRQVYLTSGSNRRLKLGQQVVELRNAPSWQVSLPGTRAGAVLRAVEWLGPEVPEGQVETVVSALGRAERQQLHTACAGAPTWLANRLTGALFPESAKAVTVGDG